MGIEKTRANETMPNEAMKNGAMFIRYTKRWLLRNLAKLFPPIL